MILADISGYTKFMVANQLAAVHGQQCITFLIETIIRQVDIPLHLQEIEGDAVFLYAVPADGQLWSEVFIQIRTKLVRFFEVFIEAMIIWGRSGSYSMPVRGLQGCAPAQAESNRPQRPRRIQYDRWIRSGLGGRRNPGAPAAQELRAEPRIPAHDRGCVSGPRARDERALRERSGDL